MTKEINQKRYTPEWNRNFQMALIPFNEKIQNPKTIEDTFITWHEAFDIARELADKMTV